MPDETTVAMSKHWHSGQAPAPKPHARERDNIDNNILPALYLMHTGQSKDY